MRLSVLFRSFWSRIFGRQVDPSVAAPPVEPRVGADEGKDPATATAKPERAAGAAAAPAAEASFPAEGADGFPDEEIDALAEDWLSPEGEAPRHASDGGDGSALEIVDDLDAAIGAAFQRDVDPRDLSPGTAQTDYDDAAARELFASIASNYSRPVKNFIIELKRGTATKDWIQICQPVMGSIIDGAESLDLAHVAQRMVDFREALSLAEASEGRGFDEDSRELILSCYDELVEVLPETFVLDAEDRRRESIIVHSLLRQIPEVGRVTLEKLYAAGLTSLDALFLATEEDISSTTGVPVPICRTVCEKIREHREQLEGASPETAQFDHRARLVELVRELQRHHEAFHRASLEDSPEPEQAVAKRDSLRNRQACALQINVVLAEMGEVELVDLLRRMAVERRIDELHKYLASTPVPASSSVPGDTATQSTGSRPEA